MAPLTKKQRSIAAKFRRYQKAKEQAKKFYDRADFLLMDIASQIKPHHSARIREDGAELHLVEARADEKGIIGWGHGAVRQYDLKVVNP